MAEFNTDFLPLHAPLVDKEGNLSPTWENYFKSLHNTVSNNFNTSGTHLPTIEAGALAKTPTGALENGASYYNLDTNTPEIIVNGQRHSFNTTAI